MSSNTTQTRYTRYNIKFVSDKVCLWLATGRWFSPGTPLSSTNETDRHNIAEILLKVPLNTINQTFIMIFELTKIILYRLERFPKRYKNIIWSKNNIDAKCTWGKKTYCVYRLYILIFIEKINWGGLGYFIFYFFLFQFWTYVVIQNVNANSYCVQFDLAEIKLCTIVMIWYIMINLCLHLK